MEKVRSINAMKTSFDLRSKITTLKMPTLSTVRIKYTEFDIFFLQFPLKQYKAF